MLKKYWALKYEEEKLEEHLLFNFYENIKIYILALHSRNGCVKVIKKNKK